MVLARLLIKMKFLTILSYLYSLGFSSYFKGDNNTSTCTNASRTFVLLLESSTVPAKTINVCKLLYGKKVYL